MVCRLIRDAEMNIMMPVSTILNDETLRYDGDHHPHHHPYPCRAFASRTMSSDHRYTRVTGNYEDSGSVAVDAELEMRSGNVALQRWQRRSYQNSIFL